MIDGSRIISELLNLIALLFGILNSDPTPHALPKPVPLIQQAKPNPQTKAVKPLPVSVQPKPKPTRVTYEITAYSVGDDFTPSHGVTASGEKVKEGRTIACPKNLPFGTQIYIPDLNHTFVCTDRGGMIKAGHLDVYMENKSEALKFGRRKLEVVIKKGEAD